MVFQPKVPKSYTAPLHKVLQQYSMVIGMNFYLCYCPIDEITKTNKKKTKQINSKGRQFIFFFYIIAHQKGSQCRNSSRLGTEEDATKEDILLVWSA